MDTGATTTVLLPNTADQWRKQPSFDLHAANSTEIATCGTAKLILDLGLRQALTWSFVVAEIQQPFLGYDF